MNSRAQRQLSQACEDLRACQWMWPADLPASWQGSVAQICRQHRESLHTQLRDLALLAQDVDSAAADLSAQVSAYLSPHMTAQPGGAEWSGTHVTAGLALH